MSRLIDPDMVISIAKGEFGKDDLSKIVWLISHVPTAYDVDKVVGQLEEKSAYSNTIRNGDVVEFSTITTTKAVEIVKGGGIDE